MARLPELPVVPALADCTLTLPDAPPLLPPLTRSTPPPRDVVRDVPALMSTLPPAPAPLLPTRRDSEPLWPPVADPVLNVMDPDAPEAVVPVAS